MADPRIQIPELDRPLDLPEGYVNRRRVVALAIPGADPLELIGPMEVFTSANLILQHAAHRPELGYDIEVVSTRVGPIFSWPGYTISTDRSYTQVRGQIDTLVIQAIDPEEAVLSDKAVCGWLRRVERRVRRFATACTGSLLLAEAGLLDGRAATTHWIACDAMRERYPNVRVETDPIYVRDGNRYTSAGATAGMDLMLALVEEDFGREVALRTAQLLVVYLRRPGGQAQFSTQLSLQLAERDSIRELQVWIRGHLTEALDVESLAARVHMSPRNFARVFRLETGLSPARFVETVRVEAARARLEEGIAPVAAIARDCGFRNPETLRQAFIRHVGIAPQAYRSRFAPHA